jgi:hypothetical protein
MDACQRNSLSYNLADLAKRLRHRRAAVPAWLLYIHLNSQYFGPKVADIALASVDKSYYFWDPVGVNGDDNQPDFDLAESNIFHFDLYENGETFASGLSIWFNLTNDTVNAEGSVISTPTSSVSLPASTGSSPTTTSSQASSPTSSPTTSLTSSPSPSQTSTGLSSGAKAGIGVGVALGALGAIAGIVGAFLWSRSKKNATVNGEQTANPYTDNPPNTTLRPDYKVEMDGTTPQQKLMESPRAEMVGSEQIGGDPVELATNRYY